jgi:hypothetical protein
MLPGSTSGTSEGRFGWPGPTIAPGGEVNAIAGTAPDCGGGCCRGGHDGAGHVAVAAARPVLVGHPTSAPGFPRRYAACSRVSGLARLPPRLGPPPRAAAARPMATHVDNGLWSAGGRAGHMAHGGARPRSSRPSIGGPPCCGHRNSGPHGCDLLATRLDRDGGDGHSQRCGSGH